jgi:chromosome segregation protein
MKLEYVEMAGFRGFRDKVRFNLPSGFAILSGRNGTGKSTLLDGVDFALTGTINKFKLKVEAWKIISGGSARGWLRNTM